MLRWHIHYNFLLLRLLSFAMDLHWARKQEQQQQQQKLGRQDGAGPEQLQLLTWMNSIRSNSPKVSSAAINALAGMCPPVCLYSSKPMGIFLCRVSCQGGLRLGAARCQDWVGMAWVHLAVLCSAVLCTPEAPLGVQALGDERDACVALHSSANL